MVEPYLILEAKRDAAQKIFDRWGKRPLRLGTSDCVRMVAAHLRLLGHKIKLPASGSYRSINSATKALRAAGYQSVGEALDALGLERIAPAAAVAGDILELPAADQLGCFTIALGNGRVTGYIEGADGGVKVLQPIEYVAAWRVMPKQMATSAALDY